MNKGPLQFTASVNEKMITAVLLSLIALAPTVAAVEECDQPVLCNQAKHWPTTAGLLCLPCRVSDSACTGAAVVNLKPLALALICVYVCALPQVAMLKQDTSYRYPSEEPASLTPPVFYTLLYIVRE